jgi:hypothetical protein
MLKVLLGPIPESVMSAPRNEYRNASELAIAAASVARSPSSANWLEKIS